MINDRMPERVAVFDDDIKFIRMVERMLGCEGIHVEPVTTPDIDEAVRVVSLTGCGAALVDLYMYGNPQGFRLIEALRQEPSTAALPLIVTSGAHRELGRRVNYLIDRHCSLLLKPFGVEDLLDRLAGSWERATREPASSVAVPKERFRLREGTVST